MPWPPATLAGRGVIELSRSDRGCSRAGRTFLPGSPRRISPRWAFGSVPLRYSSERVGRLLSKAADYCPYCALLGDPEL